MPVSGLKPGQYVRTPAGKTAIVVSVRLRPRATARVEYSDGARQTFSQSALAVEWSYEHPDDWRIPTRREETR